jgi:hypothetical protein
MIPGKKERPDVPWKEKRETTPGRHARPQPETIRDESRQALEPIRHDLKI